MVRRGAGTLLKAGNEGPKFGSVVGVTMLRLLGCDIVGMTEALEILFARDQDLP